MYFAPWGKVTAAPGTKGRSISRHKRGVISVCAQRYSVLLLGNDDMALKDVNQITSLCWLQTRDGDSQIANGVAGKKKRMGCILAAVSEN